MHCTFAVKSFVLKTWRCKHTMEQRMNNSTKTLTRHDAIQETLRDANYRAQNINIPHAILFSHCVSSHPLEIENTCFITSYVREPKIRGTALALTWILALNHWTLHWLCIFPRVKSVIVVNSRFRISWLHWWTRCHEFMNLLWRSQLMTKVCPGNVWGHINVGHDQRVEDFGNDSGMVQIMLQP